MSDKTDQVIHDIVTNPKTVAKMARYGFVFSLLTMPKWRGSWNPRELYERVVTYGGCHDASFEEVMEVLSALKGFNLKADHPPEKTIN